MLGETRINPVTELFISHAQPLRRLPPLPTECAGSW